MTLTHHIIRRLAELATTTTAPIDIVRCAEYVSATVRYGDDIVKCVHIIRDDGRVVTAHTDGRTYVSEAAEPLANARLYGQLADVCAWADANAVLRSRETPTAPDGSAA